MLKRKTFEGSIAKMFNEKDFFFKYMEAVKRELEAEDYEGKTYGEICKEIEEERKQDECNDR